MYTNTLLSQTAQSSQNKAKLSKQKNFAMRRPAVRARKTVRNGTEKPRSPPRPKYATRRQRTDGRCDAAMQSPPARRRPHAAHGACLRPTQKETPPAAHRFPRPPRRRQNAPLPREAPDERIPVSVPRTENMAPSLRKEKTYYICAGGRMFRRSGPRPLRPQSPQDRGPRTGTDSPPRQGLRSVVGQTRKGSLSRRHIGRYRFCGTNESYRL